MEGLFFLSLLTHGTAILKADFEIETSVKGVAALVSTADSAEMLGGNCPFFITVGDRSVAMNLTAEMFSVCSKISEPNRSFHPSVWARMFSP